MRIPTNTRMHRHSKDSRTPPGSSSSHGSSSTGGCGNSGRFLSVPPTTASPTSSSSVSSSSGHSFSSTGISLLREDLCVEEEFAVVKSLSEGGEFSTSKIVLATLKKDATRAKAVIKARPCLSTSIDDFNREVEFTYLLSPHPNVVTCYNVTFLWNGSLCFLQEFAPYGSLLHVLNRRRMMPTKSSRLGETKTKLVCSQVASALEFMHQLHLVHGQVTPDNILVFKGNLSQVKLADFSATRMEGSLVVVTTSETKLSSNRSSFNPPELSELLPQEKYHVETGLDSWQLGILVCYLLQGKCPWGAADAWEDSKYRSYVGWLKKKSLKVPEPLRNCTPRFIRLFKRLCEPKPYQRSGVRELRKYLKDAWLLRKSGQIVSRRTSDVSTDSTTADHAQENEGDVKIINSLEKLTLSSSSPQPPPPPPLSHEQVDKERNLKEWMQKSGDVILSTSVE
ncbi:serine/threonine-protein kinase meng-po [Folsomia candida]|uniref:Serine/threonine-protein kinase SBK1 n=1 Tax=Folsomia candida TaxID=158441 RepID=A0A226EC76_FOLCA|nr:serine/threonine-protein kinase meng-po [Folsomia candida]OXA55163.1 Serine/threonine-protein kinase SBK1 [Folsomia candida]